MYSFFFRYIVPIALVLPLWAIASGCLTEDADPQRSTRILEKALFTDSQWRLEQTVLISDPSETLTVGLSSGLIELEWEITEEWLAACRRPAPRADDPFCEPVGWFPIEAHVGLEAMQTNSTWQEREALVIDWNLLVDNTFFFPNARAPGTTVGGVQLTDPSEVELHYFDPDAPLFEGMPENGFRQGELYLIQFDQTVFLFGSEAEENERRVGIRTTLLRQEP